jgi:uncharacterized protein (TIGR02284 family)
MAIQSNVQPDARSRSDESGRETTATEGGHPATIRNGQAAPAAVDDLLHKLEKSAQTLRHTAESVENRGLKLLLKVLAQERSHMFNRLRQAVGQETVNPLDSANESSATSLQHGLQDIQTSMTVQRQGRESVALTRLVEEEDELLSAYSATLESGPSNTLKSELESQRVHIAQFYTRLIAVETGIEPIIARVFDTHIEGESAVTRLRERGLDGSQIDVAPMTRLARPVLQTTVAPAGSKNTPKNTMAAGALSGAVVGGIVGLALAAFVWFAPNLVGWVTVGPWALLIGAIVIGAIFGLVFGTFIGQNQREDDLAVTEDGLINGEILVVAYPQPNQVAMVEDVLQVHHARELNR